MFFKKTKVTATGHVLYKPLSFCDFSDGFPTLLKNDNNLCTFSLCSNVWEKSRTNVEVMLVRSVLSLCSPCSLLVIEGLTLLKTNSCYFNLQKRVGEFSPFPCLQGKKPSTIWTADLRSCHFLCHSSVKYAAVLVTTVLKDPQQPVLKAVEPTLKDSSESKQVRCKVLKKTLTGIHRKWSEFHFNSSALTLS